MTEQELVEALLDRFVDVMDRLPLEKPGEDSPVMVALARECLRQMRWAYACGINEASDSSSFHGCAGSKPAGIDAIAPSDWQP